MGHKVHPVGFRLGIVREWQAKWYADANYATFVHEDLKLRNVIATKYKEAGISLLEIERQAKDVTVTLHTARPGIVIGRGGQRVDEMRQFLEKTIGKRVRLNINEIRQPELDAYLVARNIAEQIERRVAYRRAMKQAIFRTMQAGAKGIRVMTAGRLGDAEIARRQLMHQGQVPLHTLRADIDYAFTEAMTVMGKIGVKVWIYKGEVIETKKAEGEEAPKTEEAAIAITSQVAPAAEPAVVNAPMATGPKSAEAIAPSATETADLTPAPATEEKPKPRVRKARKPAESSGKEGSDKPQS